MILFGHNIVVGYNAEPTMRPFGWHRERIGPKGGFVAVGCWPLLVAVSSRTPVGERWSRRKPGPIVCPRCGMPDCLGPAVAVNQGGCRMATWGDL